MARSAASALAESWEPGDELILRPEQGLYQQVSTQIAPAAKPQPVPWEPIGSAEMIQLAYLLTQAAALISEAKFSSVLLEMATSVTRKAMSTLIEDFERCGNKPRPKFPKKGPLSKQDVLTK